MTMAPQPNDVRKAACVLTVVAASTAAMIAGALILGRTATVLLAAIVMTTAFTVLEATIRDDVPRTPSSTRSDLTTNLIMGSIIAGFLAITTGMSE